MSIRTLPSVIERLVLGYLKTQPVIVKAWWWETPSAPYPYKHSLSYGGTTQRQQGTLCSSCSYVRGDKHGMSVTFHNRTGHTHRRCHYLHGKRHGRQDEWEECNYGSTGYQMLHGVRHGPYTSWGFSGAIENQGCYHKGEPHGLWRYSGDYGYGPNWIRYHHGMKKHLEDEFEIYTEHNPKDDSDDDDGEARTRVFMAWPRGDPENNAH